MSRPTLISAAVLALAVMGAPASADVSQGVISTFRGQVVVTKDELPDGKGDKDTIGKIRAAQLKEVVGDSDGEITHWHFHYTAFLTKTGASELHIDFMNENGKGVAANKSLEGVDPKSYVLSGDISIDENEGLTKGHTYSVEVVQGSSNVLAKSNVTFK